MTGRAAAVVVLVLLLAAGANTADAQSPPPEGTRWYRGNTHSHTLNSDGNASPAEVARWYRDNGYAFVVISDHETVTDVDTLNRELGVPDRFLVISGEEITQRVADGMRPASPRQAHVVAIGITRPILPLGDRGLAGGTTVSATFARNVAEVRRAGGISQVNHPNFRWSVRPGDMLSLPDSTLFELWNAQPRINNGGGTDDAGNTALSTEALWDTLLTRGKLLYGVASDDAHNFRNLHLHDPESARPGGGWVMVRAAALTRDAIMSALRSGSFYSSTGVTLEEYEVSRSEIRIRVAGSGPRDDRRYQTRFIGRGGRVLREVAGTTAKYLIRGNEGYVRATVTDSNGRRAWTQPIMVVRPGRARSASNRPP